MYKKYSLSIGIAVTMLFSTASAQATAATTEKNKSSDKSVQVSVPQTKIIDGRRYKLTFDSEFNKSRLNADKWIPRFTHEESASSRGGGIIWSPQTTYLDGDGSLVMAVFTKMRNDLHPEFLKKIPKDVRWVPFTRMLRTKKTFKYGYYEFKVKMPIIKGVGMAIWMQSRGMTSHPPSLDGSGGTEIDLIEQTFFDRHGKPTDYKHTTVHWGGYGKHHQYITIGVKAKEGTNRIKYNIFGKANNKLIHGHRTFYSKKLDFRDNKFHIISMLWTPKFYKFYYDNILIGVIRKGISQAPEYIILWPRLYSFHQLYKNAEKGLGTRSTTQAKYLFDYVRIYQLSENK